MNYSHLKIGLFIPCYVDQFYPQVGVATLELLEKLGCTVSFPLNQTCCGQPMANSGFEHLTTGCNNLFFDSFAGFDYVVSPSGSCVLHIKDHLKVEDKPAESKILRKKVYELVEFITDILKIDFIEADFPHRVGLHQGCHGQRGLHLSQMSELNAPAFSKPETLLRKVKGLELIELDRKDECCGFGGTFSVKFDAISSAMAEQKINNALEQEVDYIISTDLSCLLHLQGYIDKHKIPLKTMHLADVLANGWLESTEY